LPRLSHPQKIKRWPVRFHQQANDIGFTRCKGKNALTAAGDQDGRMRLLNRLGKSLELRNVVIRSAECQWRWAKQALDHPNSLNQPADADAGPIIGNAGLCIIGAEIACAEAKLKATSYKQVERCGFLGQ
jgi:hypothetical protein